MGWGLRHLHPPFLRALGMQKKLKVPYRVATPLMKVLAKGKVLRGTKLAIFGYAKVRKLERIMRDRYIEEILYSLESLTDTNFFLAWQSYLIPSVDLKKSNCRKLKLFCLH